MDNARSASQLHSKEIRMTNKPEDSQPQTTGEPQPAPATKLSKRSTRP